MIRRLRAMHMAEGPKDGQLRVAVLMGGRSSEREASMASGRSVCLGLTEAGHFFVPILVDSAGVWRMKGKVVLLEPGGGLDGVDVVFPALHGPFGEDGTVQGLLECIGLPYVGPDVLASAVCMDKLIFKELMKNAGVRQADYRAARVQQFRSDREALLERLASLGFPVFVKPARLGSSIGVARVASVEELAGALEIAFEHDEIAVVERAVNGLEVECGVIGNEGPLASKPGEVAFAAGDSGWFDYTTKFTPGAFNIIIPARVPEDMLQRIRELAVKIFLLTRCCGLSRVDLIVDGENIYINEVNTMPGLSQNGVFAWLWKESGLSYPQLMDQLVKLALERHDAKSRHRY
jgi:D-alanine-D-alanine ligase